MDQNNNTDNGLETVGHDYNNATADHSGTSVDSHAINCQATPISEQPPAIRIKLNGKYLIEASAGTGKTWTLTGIVLRLLIEAKRAPEHIIATTFTRAAAAGDAPTHP